MVRAFAANGPIGVVDEALVIGSSLAVVGSFFWAPLAFYAIWRKCETTRAKVALIISALLVTVFVPLSPRRSFRQNRLWDAWHRYTSTQIVQDFSGALDESMAHMVSTLAHRREPREPRNAPTSGGHGGSLELREEALGVVQLERLRLDAPRAAGDGVLPHGREVRRTRLTPSAAGHRALQMEEVAEPGKGTFSCL